LEEVPTGTRSDFIAAFGERGCDTSLETRIHLVDAYINACQTIQSSSAYQSDAQNQVRDALDDMKSRSDLSPRMQLLIRTYAWLLNRSTVGQVVMVILAMGVLVTPIFWLLRWTGLMSSTPPQDPLDTMYAAAVAEAKRQQSNSGHPHAQISTSSSSSLSSSSTSSSSSSVPTLTNEESAKSSSVWRQL
jgi:hypothetical protein